MSEDAAAALAGEFIEHVPVIQFLWSMCPSEDLCEDEEGRTSRLCVKPHKLEHLIIHLNDHHKWTREEIAEWLEDQERFLGTQFSILESRKEGKEFNGGPTRACPRCGLVRFGFGSLGFHMASFHPDSVTDDEPWYYTLNSIVAEEWNQFLETKNQFHYTEEY